MQVTRRIFLAAAAAPLTFAAKNNKAPVILVRSGWQSVNIGDVAHTPGLLRLLKKSIPEATLVLWPNELDHGAAPMLQRAFPGLRILRNGPAPRKPWNEDPEVHVAMDEADLFLHGSGPSVVGQEGLIAWQEKYQKPAGVFGVTYSLPTNPGGRAPNQKLIDALSKCRFVYTRETVSLANMKAAGVKAPIMGFVPDATFSMDLLDEERAKPFLAENKLEARKFLAVIPRLRYTPYHLIRKTNLSGAETERREAVNGREKAPDMAKLREMIVAWVRKTRQRVLLCPEMTYELDILDPLLYRPLPDDVKPFVAIRKTFWLPDEANSVYARAAAVVSCECHSPILAITQGTPCFYIHQPEDGVKGHMFEDVGLKDWYFEIESTTGTELANRLLGVYANYDASLAIARKARAYAHKIEQDRMEVVRRTVLASGSVANGAHLTENCS